MAEITCLPRDEPGERVAMFDLMQTVSGWRIRMQIDIAEDEGLPTWSSATTRAYFVDDLMLDMTIEQGTKSLYAFDRYFNVHGALRSTMAKHMARTLDRLTAEDDQLEMQGSVPSALVFFRSAMRQLGITKGRYRMPNQFAWTQVSHNRDLVLMLKAFIVAAAQG